MPSEGRILAGDLDARPGSECCIFLSFLLARGGFVFARGSSAEEARQRRCLLVAVDHVEVAAAHPRDHAVELDKLFAIPGGERRIGDLARPSLPAQCEIVVEGLLRECIIMHDDFGPSGEVLVRLLLLRGLLVREGIDGLCELRSGARLLGGRRDFLQLLLLRFRDLEAEVLRRLPGGVLPTSNMNAHWPSQQGHCKYECGCGNERHFR